MYNEYGWKIVELRRYQQCDESQILCLQMCNVRHLAFFTCIGNSLKRSSSTGTLTSLSAPGDDTSTSMLPASISPISASSSLASALENSWISSKLGDPYLLLNLSSRIAIFLLDAITLNENKLNCCNCAFERTFSVHPKAIGPQLVSPVSTDALKFFPAGRSISSIITSRNSSPLTSCISLLSPWVVEAALKCEVLCGSTECLNGRLQVAGGRDWAIGFWMWVFQSFNPARDLDSARKDVIYGNVTPQPSNKGDELPLLQFSSPDQCNLILGICTTDDWLATKCCKQASPQYWAFYKYRQVITFTNSQPDFYLAISSVRPRSEYCCQFALTCHQLKTQNKFDPPFCHSAQNLQSNFNFFQEHHLSPFMSVCSPESRIPHHIPLNAAHYPLLSLLHLCLDWLWKNWLLCVLLLKSKSKCASSLGLSKPGSLPVQNWKGSSI